MNDKGEIDLNKEWIRLNPKMKVILERDKGSKGDTQGRKKLLAMRDFNYIRMMWQPDSEYESVEEKERKEHILKMLGIHGNTYNSDIELHEAEEEFKYLLKNVRSYRAFRAATKSLDAKINSLDEYDPDARDKQGKLVLPPDQHSKAIKAIKTDMETIDEYKQLMVKEMQETQRTRQTLVKGLTEDNKSLFNENHDAFR